MGAKSHTQDQQHIPQVLSEHFQFSALGATRKVQPDIAPEGAAHLEEHEVTDVGCHRYHTERPVNCFERAVGRFLKS